MSSAPHDYTPQPLLNTAGQRPSVTIVRLDSGFFAAREPVQLHMAEIRLDDTEKRVHLVFPYAHVDFTTVERLAARIERNEAGEALRPSAVVMSMIKAMGHQAAVVMSTVWSQALVESGELQRALDYFGTGIYREDFLPFPRTPITLPIDGDATDRNADGPVQMSATVADHVRGIVSKLPASTASLSPEFVLLDAYRTEWVGMAAWGEGTPEETKSLVLGNLNGFAGFVARKLEAEATHVQDARAKPRILEAVETHGWIGENKLPTGHLALTVAWPDGSETLEFMSEHAAQLIGWTGHDPVAA